MVPASLEYHTEAFEDAYGESPDVDGAKQTLEDAGRRRPRSRSRSGARRPTTARLRRRVHRDQAPARRQRAVRGDPEVDRVEPVHGGRVHRQVPAVYQLGWFPDYPDADNYVGAFLRRRPASSTSTTATRRSTSCSPRRRRRPTPRSREEAFARIQEIAAEDAPIIPIWEGKQVAGGPGGRRGRRGDLRPVVHLPLLADHEELDQGPSRRPTAPPAGAVGRRPKRVGGRRCKGTEPRCGPTLLTRMALAIPMVLILLTMVFLLMRVAPGDPITAALGGRLPQEELEQRREAARASTSRSSSSTSSTWATSSRLDFGTTHHRQPDGELDHRRERRGHAGADDRRVPGRARGRAPARAARRPLPRHARRRRRAAVRDPRSTPRRSSSSASSPS